MDYPRHPNTQCFICNKPFYRKPFYLRRSKSGHAFCSMKCYGLFIRKEHPCAVCGHPILAGLNKKTCSRACSNKQRTGIKYRQGRRKDKVVHTKQSKVRILELRGSCCERCGFTRTEILQVHHRDRNRANNDIDNLELICPNCHAMEHYLEKSWFNDYKRGII